MDDVKRLMQEKIDVLNKASRAYYSEGEEIMSNFEYDRIYDELVELEKKTGIILAGSPTQRVGYEIVSELPKERHPQRMLSLDKTKDRDELAAWLGDKEGLLSWKMDGLTVVLTYDGGTLAKAVTRGNGDVGEVITANARTFVNVPLSIAFKGHLVLRGEAIITYKDFEEINATITDPAEKYKNPRNLCAGSVRQLSSEITASRHVRFYAFTLVSAEGVDFGGRRRNQMKWLSEQGFDTVYFEVVTQDNIRDAISRFESRIPENPVPSDGLVLTYDDMVYSASLGTTTKYPRDAIAFKWKDQTAETTLRDIEWSASRTGLINPVAVFDPVELEGTTVTRASVHNVSIVKDLKLGIGDKIEVYKANMIIPQIAENLTQSGTAAIPDVCPVCGTATVIKNENGSEALYCPNPACLAKNVKSFTLFVSRDAMNIEGLSEMTVEKLIDRGIIKEYADIFRLSKHRDEIVGMEGLGEKSYANLQESVDKARTVTPEHLLYALGIPGIGAANARVIARACRNDFAAMRALTAEELAQIPGVGGVLSEAYVSYFSDPAKNRVLDDLLTEIKIDETFEETGTFLAGKTFVITGSLEGYANRNELQELIEQAGGSVSGSVSAKTSYLINNDLQSASTKNKKARELGVPVIDEATITKWLKDGKIGE